MKTLVSCKEPVHKLEFFDQKQQSEDANDIQKFHLPKQTILRKL